MRQYTFRLSLGRDEIMLMYQGQVNVTVHRDGVDSTNSSGNG